MFRVVNRIIEGGHEPRRFAADMLDHFRDLIVLASVPDAGETGLLDAPPDRLELMSQQAARFGLASLTRAAEIMSNGLDQMRGATSPRLLLELMCAQVLLPSAGSDEKALLARLERLERGVGFTGAQQPSPPTPAAATSPARPVAAPAARPPAAPAAGPAVPAAPAAGPAVPAAPARPPCLPRPPGLAEPADAATPEEPDVTPAAQVPPGPPPEEHAPPAQPARADESAGAGLATTDSFGQNWDAVLEAIKRERRVAWMLLSNATVLSLEGSVLTLRFARDGDVKGFTTSGCDADLKRVLSSQFGLNVSIKAVSANDPAAARDSRPRLNPVPAPPATSGSPAPAGGAPGRSEGDWPGQENGGERRTSGGWGSPADQQDSGDGGGRGGSRGPGGAAPQASAAPQGSAPPQGRAAPQGSAAPQGRAAPAAWRPCPSPTLRPRPAPPAPRPAPVTPRGSAVPGPAIADAIDIPDADDLASPGQAEISGMDLIQRELGGQIIGEIED